MTHEGLTPLSRFASSPQGGTPPLARQSRFHGGTGIGAAVAQTLAGKDARHTDAMFFVAAKAFAYCGSSQFGLKS
jgi:hypothetical protein